LRTTLEMIKRAHVEVSVEAQLVTNDTSVLKVAYRE